MIKLEIFLQLMRSGKQKTNKVGKNTILYCTSKKQ